MAKLPQSGIELQVINTRNNQRALDAVQRGMSRAGLPDVAKLPIKGVSLPKAFDTSGILSKVTDKIKLLNQSTLGAIPGVNRLSAVLPNMSAIVSSIPPLAPVILATAAVAGALIAGRAALSLGKRGAENAVIAQAFGNIVSGANTSAEVLANLRQQTRGTISDLGLMRLTTLALQGTSQEFRDVVAQDLGAVLDITKRVGDATGQGEQVREKFLLGLRRQSALLLDDVGVTVDAEAAYRAYADRLGLQTAALTDQQKQAAFAAEAIRQLKLVGEEIGAPGGILEALSRPAVLLQNTLDKISIAVQPALEPVAAAIGAVTDKLQTAVNITMPLIRTGAEIVGAVLTQSFNAAGAALDATIAPLFSAAGQILPYLVAGAQIVGEGIAALINLMGSIVTRVFEQFGYTRDAIFGDVQISIESLAAGTASGAGRIMGTYAAGLLKGGTYVLQVVTIIAKFYADFFQGFSPPKRGALSDIDRQGEKRGEGWLTPLLGASVGALGAVTVSLGVIGSYSAQNVANRLVALDSAIQPYVDSLEIIKSDYEALAIDPALSAIQKARESAVLAFQKGQISAEYLRTLDSQADTLKSLQNAQQDAVDRAELQLAIVKGSQARERALLAIQQHRVGKPIPASTTAGGSASSAATTAPTSPAAMPSTSGGSAGGAASMGGGGIPSGGAPDIVTSEAVEHARRVLGEGFAAGLEKSGLSEAVSDFESSRQQLDTQLQRFSDFDFLETIRQGVASLIPKFNAVDTAKTAFSAVFGSEGIFITAIKDGFGEGGVLSPLGSVASAVTATLTGENSIGSLITAAAAAVTPAFTNVGWLRSVSSIFGDTGITAVLGSAQELVTGIFTGSGVFGSAGVLAVGFMDLFTDEGRLSISAPLKKIFGEEGSFETTLSGVQSVVSGFRSFINRNMNVISRALNNVFGTPDSVIQGMKTMIDNGMKSLKEKLAKFASPGSRLLKALGRAIAAIAAIVPLGFANVLSDLVEEAINGILRRLPGALKKLLKETIGFDADGGIDIPRLGGSDYAGLVGAGFTGAEAIGSAQRFLGLADGALGYRGAALVGERGAELVTPYDLMAKPQPLYVNSGAGAFDNTHNNQRVLNQTFNQHPRNYTPENVIDFQMLRMARGV